MGKADSSNIHGPGRQVATASSTRQRTNSTGAEDRWRNTVICNLSTIDTTRAHHDGWNCWSDEFA